MMNQWMNYMENDPRHHTSKIKKELSDLVEHLREDERKVDDLKARALFETMAEVLTGLKKAYDDYENQAPRGNDTNRPRQLHDRERNHLYLNLLF